MVEPPNIEIYTNVFIPMFYTNVSYQCFIPMFYTVLSFVHYKIMNEWGITSKFGDFLI